MTVLDVVEAPRALDFCPARSAIRANCFRNASWSNSGASPVPVPVAVSAASALEEDLSFPNKRDARSIRGFFGSFVRSNMKFDRYASMASSTVILSVPSMTAKILGNGQRRFRHRKSGNIPPYRCAADNVEYVARLEGNGENPVASLWGGVQLGHDLPEYE